MKDRLNGKYKYARKDKLLSQAILAGKPETTKLRRTLAVSIASSVSWALGSIHILGSDIQQHRKSDSLQHFEIG
ncbi:MAG: hypothetical protein HC781_11355 [Leptolyngbyaceae cyanobacterium CSU_1_4]|nr:hypothetical protein [Leptolyngbyaceae cyanobacterium CSU_1_4]